MMKVDKEQKRLKAIKLKYVLFPTRCCCCKEEYKREKMWQVYRYGINASWVKFHYCQNCMHSAEDVLERIDTDKYDSGIAGVDDFIFFKKKNRNGEDNTDDNIKSITIEIPIVR